MNIIKDFIKPVVVLTVICLVVAGVLAYTYEFTAPIIAQGAQAEADASKLELLPEADSFEEIELSDIDGLISIHKAKNGAGYVTLSAAQGFGGLVNVMTGITADGKITGVKLMENQETPNLGTKVGDAAYTEQYIGKDMNLEGIEAVTGATVSSKAFAKAVNIAFVAYGKVAGVEVEMPEEPEEVDPLTTIFPEEELVPAEMAGFEEAYTTASGGVVIVWPTKGYEDKPMDVIVGLNPDGTIAGVRLGENEQTPGIGTMCAEPSYTDQYIGRTDTKDLDAVSGATVTSDAFRKAVREVLEAYSAAKGA